MIGCDITEIERIKKSLLNSAFREGVFTAAEREYCDKKSEPAQSYAGLFCAKEAVAKALGSGFSGFRPADIEIAHDAAGAPVVSLAGGAARLAGGGRVELSISHAGLYAMAVATLVKAAEEGAK